MSKLPDRSVVVDPSRLNLHFGDIALRLYGYATVESVGDVEHFHKQTWDPSILVAYLTYYLPLRLFFGHIALLVLFIWRRPFRDIYGVWLALVHQ